MTDDCLDLDIAQFVFIRKTSHFPLTHLALSEQNLYGSKEPAAKKVLIVCPVSLTTVRREFPK